MILRALFIFKLKLIIFSLPLKMFLHFFFVFQKKIRQIHIYFYQIPPISSADLSGFIKPVKFKMKRS